LQAVEQPMQFPEEQYWFGEQLVGGTTLQHCAQVVAFVQILVVATTPSQPVIKLVQLA